MVVLVVVMGLQEQLAIAQNQLRLAWLPLLLTWRLGSSEVRAYVESGFSNAVKMMLSYVVSFTLSAAAAVTPKPNNRLRLDALRHFVSKSDRCRHRKDAADLGLTGTVLLLGESQTPLFLSLRSCVRCACPYCTSFCCRCAAQDP